MRRHKTARERSQRQLRRAKSRCRRRPPPSSRHHRRTGCRRDQLPRANLASSRQQEQLRIVADPATNSLIIYGTVQEYQNVKNILKELDAVPRQVLIDALILAELTLKDNETFGVDYEILADRRNDFRPNLRSTVAITSLGELFPRAAGLQKVEWSQAAIIGRTIRYGRIDYALWRQTLASSSISSPV